MAEALEFLYSPSRLWAVEPNPALSAQLGERVPRTTHVSLLFGSCLGEASGEISFNAYDFDAASSVFACKAGHLAGLGFSEEEVVVNAPNDNVARVASWRPGNAGSAEARLPGRRTGRAQRARASESMAFAEIYCEVSIDSIYDGAPLWCELHDFLRSNGFELRNVSGFAGTGATIQWADALYANARLVAA